MLLRSSLSGTSGESCADCLGSTSEVIDAAAVQPRSFVGRLIDLAESGWLPDAVIRFGMRRLLRQRLRDNSSKQGRESCLADFIKATRVQPIALSADRANEQHYEVPAAFFEEVLGPHLKYSCCYWNEKTDSLAQAELQALELTGQHAELEDGQSILELGCGWGSLSLWMAEKYPRSRITAVSNSNSQREYILQVAKSRGLGNLRVITANINDFEPVEQYDRVVSVEMFEHVRNHHQLLERIAGWLRTNGKLLVHIFCHRDTPYLFQEFGESNWMGRYFFTGGMMPSFDLLPAIAGNLSARLDLEQSWHWNGRHYAKTCRHWLKKQDKSQGKLEPVLASVYGVACARLWNQRWRMFFMACEELFAFNNGNEWFVAHYLFSKRG